MALAGATPAMMYHLVVVNDEADSQEAFFGSGLAPAPPTGFNPVVLPLIGPPPPPQSGSAGAGQVQEFRRVCSVANLTICAPPVRVLLAARCVATHAHTRKCAQTHTNTVLLLLLLLLHASSASFVSG